VISADDNAAALGRITGGSIAGIVATEGAAKARRFVAGAAVTRHIPEKKTAMTSDIPYIGIGPK